MSYNLSVSIVEFALQMLDKGIFDEEELSVIVGMDFDTGKVTNEFWNTGGSDFVDNLVSPCYNPFQIMLQMYDRQLISKDVILRKFNEMALKKENE